MRQWWQHTIVIRLYAAASSSIDGFVCLSVFLSNAYYHVPITGSSWNLHQTLDLSNACGTNGFMGKDQRSKSHGSFEVFVVSAHWLCACLICFIPGTNIVHDVTKCRDSFTGQKVKVTRVAQSVNHFQVKRSKVKVTRVIWSFCGVRSVASTLFDRITLYVAYIQLIRGWCIAPHFQDEGSSQCHTGRFKFWPYPLRAFIHIYLNHFIYGTHTTRERTMCRTPFYVICPLCGAMASWLTFGSWGFRSK